MGGEILLFDKIVELCKENEISIARLERELGLGNATIRGWKTSSPTVDNLLAVAKRFGMTVDELLQEDNEQ